MTVLVEVVPITMPYTSMVRKSRLLFGSMIQDPVLSLVPYCFITLAPIPLKMIILYLHANMPTFTKV